MSQSISIKSKDMQPATGLWESYQPQNAPYAFKATDRMQAMRWQTKTRKMLAKKVGIDVIASSSKKAIFSGGEGVRVLEEVDKKDYIRQKLLLRTGPCSLMPVYLLLPKDRPQPLPVVLALNGHGYGVKDIVGLWEDGQERNTPDGYHKDFAVELCRAGFAVAAPEISCFGERQTDFSYLGNNEQLVPTTCSHTAMLASHLGSSVVGLRVHDGMKLIDYLETRDDLDTTRLGAMGISGGGMHTFFSTGLDLRIKACVISGYYATFRDSILAMMHCPCNFVPGLADFGEMYDLVGLIAPRPMLVEAGNHDEIFPIKSVRSSVTKARSVYKVFGGAGRVETDYFEGRHQISGRKAYDFLKQALNV